MRRCLLVLAFACADPGPSSGPTWHQDVAPLVAEHCGSCHIAGALADPILLDSYAEATRWGPLMKAAVQSGSMPPFKARETEECTPDAPWMNDARLSEEAIDTITAWVDADMPEGDPTNATSITSVAPASLEDAVELHPGSPFDVPPAGELADVFTCVSLDPGLQSSGWLEGYQVLPDSGRVVHHALVAIDEAGTSAALADENGRYDCRGGFGVAAQFIGGWVPGGAPVRLPEGSALEVPAGARIIVQMHYHLVDETVPDATGVALKWADDEPERAAFFGLFGNGQGLQPDPDDGGLARLYIPAGARGHTEHLVIPWRVPVPLRVFLVSNHMHYTGTRMRVWVERASAPDACVLDTPDWDFDWQQTYFYDASAGAGPVLESGDELHIECTYDNSMDNPALRAILREEGIEEPVDVSLGEGSLDEMCLVTLGGIPTGAALPERPTATHTGTASMSLRTSDGTTEDACEATAQAIIEGGVVRGRVECEVFAYQQNRTLTAVFTGVNIAEGAVGGVGSFDLSNFATGPANWTGTLNGDGLQLEMSEVYPLMPDLEVELSVVLEP